MASLRVAFERALAVALAASVCLLPQSALAWGDEGHEIIALVGERFLDPAVREKIAGMLAADPDNLTAHDIASAATWADRYRDSDRRGGREHYARTRNWHFVNVVLGDMAMRLYWPKEEALDGKWTAPPLKRV